MAQESESYSDIVNGPAKPIKWNVDPQPQTSIGKAKKEMVYIFWFEFLGTFMLTFSIYASNNNPFVLICVYGLLILLAQNQKCTFNPAVTSTLAIGDTGQWVAVALGSQFAGAFLAGLIGLISFSNYIDDVPYINLTTLGRFPAIATGEVLGSMILTIGFIFQYDELLEFSSDRVESSIIIASLYGMGRTLSYVSQSSLNPAIALSLSFFESCKDGEWHRFWTSWIFIGFPFVGGFIALSFIHVIYKSCYEQQIKIGLRI